VGIAYSGYSWKRNALTSFMPAILTIATCTVQWFIIGYTLAYGEGGLFFGSWKHLFHKGVLSEPVGTIPAILFSEFQLVFEATVCAIAVGGFCERGRLLPVIPFIFLWSTFIYCPLAHMVWGGGWLGENLGVLDFAGGKSSYHWQINGSQIPSNPSNPSNPRKTNGYPSEKRDQTRESMD
jgi:Amt family ammonium transporter